MSAPIDEARLAAIDEWVNAATPGPWEVVSRSGVGQVRAAGRILCGVVAAHDAEMMAHARTDVPDLVAEVRRLTAALATARREGTQAAALAQIAGAEAVRNAVMGYLDEIFPDGPAAADERWPHELMEHVACAVARAKRSAGGAS